MAPAHQTSDLHGFFRRLHATRKLFVTNDNTEGHELRAEYLLDAPLTNTWRCWTESKLLERWFHPESWTTEMKALDQRPFDASHIVMHGPNGEVSDGVGIFLEAIPQRRLVFTNIYTSGWIPSGQPSGAPFRTMMIEMSDEGGRTRYVVRALHWTEKARKEHKEMGFHQGWKQTTRQFEALARSL